MPMKIRPLKRDSEYLIKYQLISKKNIYSPLGVNIKI